MSPSSLSLSLSSMNRDIVGLPKIVAVISDGQLGGVPERASQHEPVRLLRLSAQQPVRQPSPTRPSIRSVHPAKEFLQNTDRMCRAARRARRVAIRRLTDPLARLRLREARTQMAGLGWWCERLSHDHNSTWEATSKQRWATSSRQSTPSDRRLLRSSLSRTQRVNEKQLIYAGGQNRP